MKIHEPPKAIAAELVRKEQLQTFLNKYQTPSMLCATCPRAKSLAKGISHPCQFCPDLDTKLSSDPERYPLEPATIPIVLAMESLEAIYPCWSCEGHADANQKITKAPKIVFLCEHAMLPELVVKHIAQLYHQRHINYFWQISLYPVVERPGYSTWALQPNEMDADDLKGLQEDLITIGNSMIAGIPELAKEALSR